ncbi:MAG: NAD kinase [Bacteroidia bacterium]|nr:NAD kinase [Bacteroidia bacterium]
MQVVIYTREIKDRDRDQIQLLLDTLHEKQINTYIYLPIKPRVDELVTYKSDVGVFRDYLDFSIHKIDFFIALGGDGTMLNAATIVRDSGVPILGINTGRLGFLATTERKMIAEAVGILLTGRYEIETRSLLTVESNIPIFEDFPHALNDFTILKRDVSSMISIHTYINGDYLNSYWADGIIVSTPTGSTGYSLSCGGPIVFPNSGNFVITPVAPHNLTVRPIVIPDDAVVSFSVEGRSENFLCTLDSRFELITSEHNIAVQKCPFQINLVRVDDRDFLKTIRDKLAWGKDARN